MERVDCNRAYYIKLGHGGEWEQICISESTLRIGFERQDVQDINRGDWEKIKQQLIQEARHKKGVATKDLNALRSICESTPEDLWITFSQGKLWWCRVGSREIFQGETSKYKYRQVDRWSDKDVYGGILGISSIPGELSKIQAFRGTFCRVGERETLRRLVNAAPSPEYGEVETNYKALSESVKKAIKKLHWKDFETLVDLVFRGSGWHRVSMLGGTMKGTDLELEDPITGDRYQVQVKAQATMADFESYSNEFKGSVHRKLYFVAHTPDEELAALHAQPRDVELILPDRLSEMVVRLGLVDWLMNRIK